MIFPFILRGLFDPEGLGAEAGLHKKRKRLDQPRQANVPRRKKGDLSFYSPGVI
ncbi:hypothetical protein [Rossellomorea vietnamensis]|uniref:hypothetical protein n=1 Tax=Rossellomorea vietnamensis TaxID=218284 RepID=UPI003CF6F990